MAITVNTKVLSNSITDLGKVSDYYYRKISDFAKTSSATPLANVLADVRANYESIAKNVINFSNYLVSYYNDIQALEFKMSNSGSAYISESTVASIVSQYNNSITKTSISYDKIFDNIQVADFSGTEVTAQNSMDLSSFSFDMETIQAMLLLAETDKSLNEEQIDFLTAYYHNYYELERQKQTTEVSLAQKEFDQIDKVEKNLRGYGYDFASLESAIQMAKANGDEQELKKLQKLLKDTGYKGKEEYDCALKEAKEKLQIQSATLHSVEQYLKTLPYTFQIRDEKYQNYQSSSSVKKENLQDCIVQTDALTTIDYKAYCKKYGDVDPYSFMKTVKENYKYAEVTGMENKDLISRLVDAGTVSPELANFYVYSYETNGSHASKEYLEAMEEQINMHCGELEAKKFLDSLADLNDEETRLKALSNHLQVSGKGLFDGAEGFASNIGYAVEGLFTDKENRVYSASEYETMFILQGIATQKDKLAAGLISEDSNGVVVSSSSFIDYTADYGKLLDHNYQISQSIGNMLPSIAISAVNPIAGKLSFGLSAGGGSYHSAMVEGFSKDKALAYGAFSGASEVVTEKFLGAIPLLSDVNVTNFKTFFQSAFKEGVEEFVQSYMDAGASSAILNKTTDFDELRGEAVTSALYGMITGGIMNTPSLAINRIGSHFSSPSMSESDIKALSNEYKQVVKEQMTDLAKENRKNVSHGKTGSLLAGAGLFGIGADIFGGKGNHSSNSSGSASMATNNQGNEASSLKAKRDQILRDNPRLAAIEEQYKNGERITVPKDLSDSFTELRKISAELNTMNLGQKVTSSYVSKVSTPSKFSQTLTNMAQSVSNLLKRSTSKATPVTDGVAKSSIDSMMNKEHLDVAKQNRKNVSHRKSGSSFSKTSMDGNISSGSSIHQVNDVSSLQARKDQILRDNPRLAAIEEQYKNGERITVPKDLSDSFTELRKISAELAQYTIDLSEVKKVNTDFSAAETIADVENIIAEKLDMKTIFDSETIKSLPKALLGMIDVMGALGAHFKYDSVTKSETVTNKILNEGLYHVTSLESAQKILESGYVKASDVISSYGKKKSFFFAGEPSVRDVSANVPLFADKRIAVKIDIDESQIGDLRYRSLGDQAITHNGDFSFDPSKARIAYLGMFQENGKLVYKEISKTEFDNYKSFVKKDAIHQLKANLQSTVLGMASEYDNTVRRINLIKNTFANANISNTLANISQSITSILNTPKTHSDMKLAFASDIDSILSEYNQIIDQYPEIHQMLENDRKGYTNIGDFSDSLVKAHLRAASLEQQILNFQNNTFSSHAESLSNLSFRDVKSIIQNNVSKLKEKLFHVNEIKKKTNFIDLINDVNHKEQSMTVGDLKRNVLDSVPNGLNVIEKARWAYLELGKVLNFDENLHDNKIADISDWHFNISDDTLLKNNKVVCVSWSKIYSDVLTSLGIENRIKGEKGSHQWVEFSDGNSFYFADATYGSLTDLAKISLGAETSKFQEIYHYSDGKVFPVVKLGDFSENLKQMDKDFQYIMDEYQRILGPKNFNSTDSISSKLLQLSEAASLNSLGFIEGKEYLLHYINELSDVEREHVSGRDFIRMNSDGKVELVNVTAVLDDSNHYQYFAFHEGVGLTEVTIHDLDLLVQNGFHLKDGKPLQGYQYHPLRAIRDQLIQTISPFLVSKSFLTEESKVSTSQLNDFVSSEMVQNTNAYYNPNVAVQNGFASFDTQIKDFNKSKLFGVIPSKTNAKVSSKITSFVDKVSSIFTNSFSKSLNQESIEISINPLSTAAMIPIKTLENILTKDAVFQKFLDFDNHRDIFGDFNRSEYILAIHEMMNLLHEKKLKVTPSMQNRFEIISKINPYRFQEIVAMDAIRVKAPSGEVQISVDSLQNILENNILFEKFINFNFNKDLFSEADQISYLVAFQELQLHLKKNRLVLEPSVMQKLQTIQQMVKGALLGIDSTLSNYVTYGADQNTVQLAKYHQPKLYSALIRQVMNIFEGMDYMNADKFLSGINLNGVCSYATAVNKIFSYFTGKEAEFKKVFGFDMYRMINGIKVLNDAQLLVDLYSVVNYASEVAVKRVVIDGKPTWFVSADDAHTSISTSRQSSNNLVKDYLATKGFTLAQDSDFEIFNSWNEPISYRIVPDEQISAIRTSISSVLMNGGSVELNIWKYANRPDLEFTFYSLGDYSNVCSSNWNEDSSSSSSIFAGGHSVFVTGIDENGDLIVSSWGKKYVLKFSEIRKSYFNVFGSKFGLVKGD